MSHRLKAVFPNLGEFRMVEKFLSARNGGVYPGDGQVKGPWMGPGDDCAVLDGWVISTDMSVEGAHFRLDWSSVEQVVEKAILSNLSDINAMGAETGFALISICLNQKWTPEIQDRFAYSFAALLEKYRVHILGGDTVAGKIGAISMTVMGKVPQGCKPLLRSCAEPGQYIYVSGRLGGPAAGLHALEGGAGSSWDAWIPAHQVPVSVPLGLGARLNQYGGMGACMDISDGLSSELHHLAIQSGVCLQIQEFEIPVCTGLRELCRVKGVDDRNFWLNGGEEYQLLFTSYIPPSLLVLAMWPYEIHCIGNVIPGSGVQMIDNGNQIVNIEPRAWSHL